MEKSDRARRAELATRREFVESILEPPAEPRYFECICTIAVYQYPGGPRLLWPSGNEHICPPPLPAGTIMSEQDVEAFHAGIAREESKAAPPAAMKRAAKPRERAEKGRNGSGGTSAPARKARTIL